MNDLSHHKQPTEKQPITSANLMMSDLVELAEADQELTPHRKRDVVSAVRSICGHLGLDPALTPASHAYFRGLFAKAHPKQMGVTRKTFQNLRSVIGFALRRYVAQDDRRGRKGLSPKWQELWDRLTDYGMKFGMSRFLRYCSDRDIMPEAVNEDHGGTFLEWLQTQTLVQHPEALHRRCLLAWNKAVDTVAGWPQILLPIPSNRYTYTLEWHDLPEGLRQDAEAWLEYLSKDDPFSLDAPPKPVRPATVKHRRFQIRQLVSALALQEHDLRRLTSLRDLVEIETVKLALRFFWERQGGERVPNSQIQGLSSALVAIAQHWCKIEPDHVEELKRLKSVLTVRHKGLTPKNRERLRQFTDRSNIEALLMLPERMFEAVHRKNEISRRDALDFQVAIALEILLMMPIRRANLVALRVGPEGQLILPRKPGERAWVVIAGDEVKNNVDLERPLPPETTKLIEAYLEQFQPILAGGPSPWLIPGEGPNGHKSLDQFSRHFTKTIRRWTGLKVNIHLMRHIGAKLYLDQNPSAYEVVRRVLGHKSLSTTLDTYTGLETESALRHYEAVILGIRGDICREVDDAQ